MSLENNTRFQRQKDFYTETVKVLSGLNIQQLSQAERIAWFKEYEICIVRELCEALDELPWKLHRNNESTIDREKLLEELIDVQKYLWNMMHVFEFTSKEVDSMFDRKSDIVEARWEEFLRGKLISL